MTFLTSFQNFQKKVEVAEKEPANKQLPEQLSELQFISKVKVLLHIIFVGIFLCLEHIYDYCCCWPQ
jgi:hypothetical protein